MNLADIELDLDLTLFDEDEIMKDLVQWSKQIEQDLQSCIEEMSGNCSTLALL